MSDPQQPSPEQRQPEQPEQPVLVVPVGAPSGDRTAGEGEAAEGTVESPAKVLRIGSMIKQLLDEVRRAPLDEAGRVRLKDIYETSVAELADGLSDDLRDELARLSSPFSSGAPSEAELRIAQAQLVGWLEGLFHGIQATLFAQQMAARAQLEEMGRRQLMPGQPGGPQQGPDMRPGTYL